MESLRLARSMNVAAGFRGGRRRRGGLHGTKQPQADPDVGEGWLGSGSRERRSPHVQASGSGAAHNGYASAQGSADRARATDLQAGGMATMMVAEADRTEHDHPVCS